MIYRVMTQDGRAINGSEYANESEAAEALRLALGWESIALSDWYCASMREGARGSIYGREAHETKAGLAAHPDGDPYAPAILCVKGDEAWALGNELLAEKNED